MPNKPSAGLGDAEAEILNIVWNKGSARVQEIWEALPPERSITPATVQSVLRRLRAKGYVKSKLSGRAHVFSAAAQPKVVTRRLVQRFLRTLFGGDPLPLLMHLAENKDLTPDDLSKIRQVVEQAQPPGKQDEQRRKHR